MLFLIWILIVTRVLMVFRALSTLLLVIEVVQFSFTRDFLQLRLNSNFLILQNVLDAFTIVNFKPIVGGGNGGIFLLKIITKILVDCLAHVVSRVVSTNQFGFIRGQTNLRWY